MPKAATIDVATAYQAGAVGTPPVESGQNFQYTVTALGRLSDPAQFDKIVVKTGANNQPAGPNPTSPAGPRWWTRAPSPSRQPGR